MTTRNGHSLVELLVACAIIGVLLALLLPAVQAARVRALEVACKNNLHQINLAAAEYAETNKRLPAPGSPGVVGGWTIALLPYLDQKHLHDRIVAGTRIPAAPEFLLRQPRLLQCPIRSISAVGDPTTMDACHYVFVPTNRRDSFFVFDAPVDLTLPWASGPEMTFDGVVARTGPHKRGFFYASGFQQGVRYILASRDPG